MIEINISELFLWVWCVVATVFALYFRHHCLMHKMVIITLLHDEESREKIISNFKEWRKQQ